MSDFVGAEPMYQQFTSKPLLIGAAIVFVALRGGQPSVAAVTFTANVPNGATALQNIVAFSVANKNNDFTSDYLEIGAGSSGNGIVSVMETDLENFSIFDGDVSGNMLTVDAANSGAYMAGAEIDMTMEVNNAGNGCAGCDLPEFPVTIGPRHTHGSLVLILAGRDGQPATVQSPGAISLNIAFPSVASAPFVFNASFASGMTTTSLIQVLDTAFRNTTWPAEIEYVGLENGFPTLAPRQQMAAFNIGTAVSSASDPGFLIGAAVVGAVPEPGSLMLCATVMSLLACCRVRIGRVR
jgi:hypothetical protein